MKDNDMHQNPYEIALIGDTGAGKTTLAVGFYATKAQGLSVTAIGGATKDYLYQRQADLESGKPPQGNVGSPDKMRLEINRGGASPVTIDFNEYMGEHLRNDLEVCKASEIGDPQGAMILLNPRMEILRNSYHRVNMITQIKDVIQYLSGSDKRCSHIAFVVTASDLLETSLKDHKEEFDGYKAEIASCLNTNPKFQKKWKEFSVTVTGHLEDPDKPRISSSANNAHEPFLWLIDQLEKDDRRARRKRKAILFGTLLLTAAVAFVAAWIYWRLVFDRDAIRTLEALVENQGKALDSAVRDRKWSEVKSLYDDVHTNEVLSSRPFFTSNQNDYDGARSNLVMRLEHGWLSWCSARMDGLAKEILKGTSGERGLDIGKFDGKNGKREDLDEFDRVVSSFRFETVTLKDELTRVTNKWNKVKKQTLEALEDAVCRNFKMRVEKDFEDTEALLRTTAKDEVISFDELCLTNWTQLVNEMRDVSLRTCATNEFAAVFKDTILKKDEAALRVDRHNGGVYERRFEAHTEEAAKSATEEQCDKWRDEIASWRPQTGEGIVLQSNLLVRVAGEREGWRSQYESAQFDKRAEDFLLEIGNAMLTIDPDNGDPINEALVKCKNYERWAQSEEIDDASVRLVSLEKRKGIWEKIKRKRGDLLDKLLQWQLRRDCLKTDTKEPPCVSDPDMDFLDAVLKTDEAISNELYDAWKKDLNDKVAEKVSEWKQKEDKACNEYIEGIKSQADGVRFTYETVKGYESFYSKHNKAPMSNEVATAVSDLVMREFEKIYSQTLTYLSNPIDLKPDDLKKRCEAMEETRKDLDELVTAIAGNESKKKAFNTWFKATKAYGFALDCRRLGKVGVDGECEFQQSYEITKIEAKIEYPSPRWRDETAAFNVEVGRYASESNAFVFSSIGDCAKLPIRENIDKAYQAVWVGSYKVSGSPWADVLMRMNVTNEFKGVDDAGKEKCWQLQRGEKGLSRLEHAFMLRRGLKVHVRIDVKSDDDDFFTVVEPYLHGER